MSVEKKKNYKKLVGWFVDQLCPIVTLLTLHSHDLNKKPKLKVGSRLIFKCHYIRIILF